MKPYALGLSLLLLSSALQAQPQAHSGQVVFRTIPTVDVYCWRRGDSRPVGNHLGRSNGAPLTLPPFTGESLKVYFVWGAEQKALVSLSDWTPEQRERIPFKTLQFEDVRGGRYPRGLFPLLALESSRDWALWGFSQPALWLSLVAVPASWAWRRRRGAASGLSATDGFRLGEYRLGKSLGKGGAGEVFAATDSQGRPVAVKLLHSGIQDEASRKRFDHEVQICTRLNHPNLLRLIDWGQQGEALYLVMELLEGETLSDRLRRSKLLTPEEFLPLWQGLGSALRALHQQGLIHRDIKPENLFIRSSGSLVLMDFGIALAQDLTRATQTGMTVGTPSYMAPEQLRGHVEPSSDQYAAGLVAFECLTGKRAFEGDDPMQVAYQQVHSPPPQPSSLHSEVSGMVDAVVLKMLEKNPQHRYPSMESAGKALEEALQGRQAELDQDTRETSF